MSAYPELPSLSKRERQILHYLLRGWSSAEIAGVIYRHQKTVHTYTTRVRAKLGLRESTNYSRRDLYEAAQRYGLIDWPRNVPLTDRPSQSPSDGPVAPAPARGAPEFFGER